MKDKAKTYVAFKVTSFQRQHDVRPNGTSVDRTTSSLVIIGVRLSCHQSNGDTGAATSINTRKQER
jgi:hypothetical protein